MYNGTIEEIVEYRPRLWLHFVMLGFQYQSPYAQKLM